MIRVNNSTIYHKNCGKKERHTRNAAQKNEVKKSGEWFECHKMALR